MIFRQLIDYPSFTYTYLIASNKTKEAVLIDPVKSEIEKYQQLFKELDLKLIMIIDTHTHADHITASGMLREQYQCDIAMSDQSDVKGITRRLSDGDDLVFGEIRIQVIATPGHTPDSICLRMSDRVMTGDTLFIRGTGRTDFQTGDPFTQYKALTEKLLSLPGDTLVYPGHDYRGMTVSTIDEERRSNPRLQVKSSDEYATMMNNLNLPAPKMIDVAVPANLHCGLKDK